MTVTVCLQEGDIVSDEWWDVACETVTADQPAEQVVAKAEVWVPIFSTWFRTTAVGSNDDGATGSSTSIPVFWFNCACYVG